MGSSRRMAPDMPTRSWLNSCGCGPASRPAGSHKPSSSDKVKIRSPTPVVRVPPRAHTSSWRGYECGSHSSGVWGVSHSAKMIKESRMFGGRLCPRRTAVLGSRRHAPCPASVSGGRGIRVIFPESVGQGVAPTMVRGGSYPTSRRRTSALSWITDSPANGPLGMRARRGFDGYIDTFSGRWLRARTTHEGRNHGDDA